MAKAKRYSTEQIQAAQKMLRGLVVKTSGKTKAEVVELLAGDVHKAVQQGHSLKDIQEMLGKAGIPVPLARLKALLAQKEDGLAHKSDTMPEEKDTAPAAKKEHAFTTGGTSQDVPL